MTPTPEYTQARAARIAGVLYVVTNATAVAALLIRSSVAGSGDLAAISQNILSGERLYRLSVVLDLITVAGVIGLFWALYVLLRPVNKDMALLAVFFRIMENAVLAVTAITMLLALRILAAPEHMSSFDAAQLASLSRVVRSSHGLGFNVGFVFLGLGSTVFAWLLLKSRYVPRWMAGWGLFASSLFVVCALMMMLFPAAASLLQIVSFVPMGLYEVGLGLWLAIRGADLTSRQAVTA